MLSTSRRVVFVLVVSLIFVCLPAAAYHQARSVAREASKFLREVQNVPIEKVSETQVWGLWQRYHRYGALERCTNEHCELEFHFTNAWLSTFKLAPFTDLYGVFVVDKGIISGKRVGMLTQTDIVDVWENAPTGDPFKVFAETPHKLQIVLTSQATTKERTDAYSLDADCLIKLGGCKSTREMNPAVADYHSSGPFTLN
jgi:hypothetical protein